MEQYPDKELEDALKTVRMLLPWRHECLACYVFRMLAHGCDGLKWSKTYRDMRAPRATALERKLPELGGYCDCEVMANVFHPNDAMWELDDRGRGRRDAHPAVPQRPARNHPAVRIVVHAQRHPVGRRGLPGRQEGVLGDVAIRCCPRPGPVKR